MDVCIFHADESMVNLHVSLGNLTESLIYSAETVTLPVKLTKPLTSILYVSHDKQHLIDMKKVVQHKEAPILGTSSALSV